MILAKEIYKFFENIKILDIDYLYQIDSPAYKIMKTKDTVFINIDLNIISDNEDLDEENFIFLEFDNNNKKLLNSSKFIINGESKNINSNVLNAFLTLFNSSFDKMKYESNKPEILMDRNEYILIYEMPNLIELIVQSVINIIIDYKLNFESLCVFIKSALSKYDLNGIFEEIKRNKMEPINIFDKEEINISNLLNLLFLYGFQINEIYENGDFLDSLDFKDLLNSILFDNKNGLIKYAFEIYNNHENDYNNQANNDNNNNNKNKMEG